MGTINNNGNFQVNGGGGVNSYIYTGANTTLQGGGTVTLYTATVAAAMLFSIRTAAYTLTNVNHTIQGEGIIYNNGSVLNNQATINANSTGGTLATYLELEYGTVNNTGLLEATNSGDLILYATTVNNLWRQHHGQWLALRWMSRAQPSRAER